MPTNFAQAMFQGMDDERQRRLQQQSMERQNRLADIALAKEERADQTDQRSQLAQLARGWKSLTDSTQKKGYYDRFIQPAVSQMGFGDLGPYDEAAVDGVASQILAAYGNSGNQGKLFAQKIGQDGFIYNAYVDGRMQNTGVKADRQAWFRDVEGQAPAIIGKSGEVIPVGGGAAPPQAPTQTPTPDGVYIDPSLPPAVQERIRQSVSMGQEPPAQMYFGQPAGGGGVAPKPTEAQTAYSKKVAELEAQLAQAKRMAEAEAKAVQLKKEAEATAERNSTTAKRTTQAQESIDTLNEAIALLPGATSGRLESLGAAGLGALGVSTRGAQATAQLRLLSAKLIGNVPRFEGPQSNIDVQFYREAAGDLANENLPSETRIAAARKMLQIAQKYVNQQGGAEPGVRRARNPQTGEVLVLRNGQWVKE